MSLGNMLLTNALEQGGIGWLRFSGDTYPPNEPYVSKEAGILRVLHPLGSPSHSIENFC